MLEKTDYVKPKSLLPSIPLQVQSVGNNIVPFAHKPCRTKLQRAYVRCFDLLVAIVALLVFSPVMACVALAIKLVMPGSIFYTQERVTRGDAVFKIYKFRTMIQDAEAKTGPTWVGTEDTRITPLGRFLRRSHLDELPQLWNVLVGEMSIVGPRPERPIFVNQFKTQGIYRYSDRHSVKAGITGYAQLLNANPSMDQIAEKTEADLWYIDHWSPSLDFALCLQTAMGLFKSLTKFSSQKMSCTVVPMVESPELSI